MLAELPTRSRRPLLAAGVPVLARGAGETQVGLDPGRALVFRGAGYPALLDALDGHHTQAQLELAARRSGLGTAQVRAALRRLRDAGLLDGISAHAALVGRSTGRPRVRLVGAGPLGRAVADLLLAGSVELLVHDPAPPERELYPSAGARSSRAEALRAGFAASGPATDGGSVVRVLDHWSTLESTPPDLTVVAPDTVEVDRLLGEHYTRHDEPFLVARPQGGTVVVGPLVVPGRTSCLRCHDLARRDADPAWPVVLTQLNRLVLRTPAVLMAWAAATVVGQAQAYLHGSWPETAGATLELDGTDFLTRRRAWPVHAGCGCAWSTRTEWGP